MINKGSCTGLAAFVLAAGVCIAPAHADTRITLSGTAPTNALLSRLTGSMTPAQWYAYNTEIGENWVPGATQVRVDYPATLGHLNSDASLDASVATGQATLDVVVKAAAALGHTVLAGLSQGVVIDAELARLANDPAAPPPASVSAVLFGDPDRGLFETYFPPGLFLGLPGLTVTRPVDSQYNVDVVVGQYDGWADPPDRPCNMIADLNAIAGTK